MTFSPHDYRSYINYGIVIQEVHDKYTSAQFLKPLLKLCVIHFWIIMQLKA